TRLAEAERGRVDLDRYLGTSAPAATSSDEDHRKQAMAMARRIAFPAGEAHQPAHRDIHVARPPEMTPWSAPQQGWRGRRGGGDLMGGILGGLVIGSILDGIFD